MGKIIDRVREQQVRARMNEWCRINEETRDARKAEQEEIDKELRVRIADAFRVDEQRFAPPPTPWWKVSWR